MGDFEEAWPFGERRRKWLIPDGRIFETRPGETGMPELSSTGYENCWKCGDTPISLIRNFRPGRRSRPGQTSTMGTRSPNRHFSRADWIVVAVAALIHFAGCPAPPGLMDDVDGAYAQIARVMLESGDWVTPRLNGVVFFDKPPLGYWMTAISFSVFGVSDWAARLPTALCVTALALLVCRFGRWAFTDEVGIRAGLVIATNLGLFLFTRMIIPDAALTLALALAMWGILRALEPEEPRPRRWSLLAGVAIGGGLLLKGLVALVFPVAVALLFLCLTGRLRDPEPRRRLALGWNLIVVIAIAAPWHILACLRNPPWFVLDLGYAPGEYRGFYWFYFINEHFLRFIGRRYPRDYNTVPRVWFVLSHLLWFFPWSLYLPGLVGLGFLRPTDRAGRTRLFAACWIGVVLGFFLFSTTQEYYTMPLYPALALLVACAMSRGGAVNAFGRIAVSVIGGLGALACAALLFVVRGISASGDISRALAKSDTPLDDYTLSLGHLGDLTLGSFAYLRFPLAIAAIAFAIGAVGALPYSRKSLRQAVPVGIIAIMMSLFLLAARLAMGVFDPYLGSKPLGIALRDAPPGRVVLDDHYFIFSSVVFYANRPVFLLNGRKFNLEYGSFAPDAPKPFLDDQRFRLMWSEPQTTYLLVEETALPRIEELVGKENLHLVHRSGGKALLSNLPIKTGSG